MINNEKGNTTLLSMAFMIIIVSAMILTVKININYYQEIENKFKTRICHKEADGISTNYIKNIETSNKRLKKLTIAKYALSSNPKTAVLASAIKKAIKVLKLMQKAQSIAFMKNLLQLQTKKCIIIPNSYYGPYKISKKDIFNRAIRRKKAWKLRTIGKMEYIQSQIHLKTQKKKLKHFSF